MSYQRRQAQELFEAARRVAPRPELARQILTRARREQEPSARTPGFGWRQTLATGFGLAALAAGVTLFVSTKPESVERGGIAAEPLRPSALALEEQEPAPAKPPPSTRAVLRERPRAMPPTTPRTHETVRSLSEQLELLKQARDALRAGAAARALTILDSYQGGTNSVDMSAEATLLRIEALVKLGRQAEAVQLVERFVARHPDNPLVDRARSLATGRTEAVGTGRESEHVPKP